MSKSIPWGKPGNFNMRGKKTARYADDVVQDLREKFNKKTDKTDIEDQLDFMIDPEGDYDDVQDFLRYTGVKKNE